MSAYVARPRSYPAGWRCAACPEGAGTGTMSAAYRAAEAHLRATGGSTGHVVLFGMGAMWGVAGSGRAVGPDG
jgi:hypothetical protein